MLVSVREMYLGSREEHTQHVLFFDGTKLSWKECTWVPALYTGLRELVDNALDEMLGYNNGDTLRVSYDPESMVFTVEDNGTGLPLDVNPALHAKLPAASVLLSEARAGSNFDERGEVGGANGLGAAVTNFTSEWFQLDVWGKVGRSYKHFRQKWTEGVYRQQDTHKTDGHKMLKGSTGKTGTRIQYKPSSKVFPKMTLPMEFVRSRLWDIAVSNRKLKVYFNDERLLPAKGADAVKFTYFNDIEAGKFEIRHERIKADFYVIPDPVRIDGLSDQDEAIHSLVNRIPTLQGGSHVDSFKNAFYNAVVEVAQKQAKKEKLTVTKKDIAQGVLMIGFVTMDGPNFDSQTKGRLITEVGSPIRSAFKELDLKAMLRRNPDWIESILDRCRKRSSARDNKDVEKEQKKFRKVKPVGLLDANGRDRSKCVLFIGEGDSAVGQITSVRDPATHGVMPLRGKIMNVRGKVAKKGLGQRRSS